MRGRGGREKRKVGGEQERVRERERREEQIEWRKRGRGRVREKERERERGGREGENMYASCGHGLWGLGRYFTGSQFLSGIKSFGVS